MRLRKATVRMASAALCVAMAISMAGCSSGGDHSASTQPPKPASSSSTATEPASSSSSDSSSASSSDLSLYPLADSNMMMQGKTWTYVFRVEANGEVLHASAMADVIVPDNPPAYEHYTKQFPFDYRVSTYVWDGKNLRCKRKGQLNAVPEEDLVGKPGYKFVCKISWFYSLDQVGTAVNENTGETYSGWIPNDLVEDAVKHMSKYHDNVVAFDKIPKDAYEGEYFAHPRYYFNGKFYKSVS